MPRGPVWSHVEKSILAELVGDGYCASDVAAELNAEFGTKRSAGSITSQMHLLGLRSVAKSAPHANKRTVVMTMLAEGMRPSIISKRLGVQKAAVNKMILLLAKDGLLERFGGNGKNVRYRPSLKWIRDHNGADDGDL